jgi:hypothetical protein
MCVNCLTQAEVAAANVAVTAAVLKAPVHRLLADVGLVAPIDHVARDMRTVAFLRSLDLDPVAVLGADVVDRADARVAERALADGAPSAVGPQLQPVPASIRR